MNALDHARNARPFHRSEAFPEDVADFVEPALQATTKAAPMQRRQRHQTMLWLLGLLPLVALAVGVTWAF
jgi:ferric-dicitrate binding protein FerR (iron transport regulator)